MKIAVFTGTRAEYGLMRKLIRNFETDKKFNLFLLVSSTHLEAEFGLSINEIKNDGINSQILIPIEINTNKKKYMAIQTASTIKLLSETLDEINPDYLVVLGDRFETFGAVITAHIMGIKIIHLHGGETSLGAIDNKIRHAISQLSTIHFTSAEIHKKKVFDIVGDAKNIHNVGPLVIDGILNLEKISKKEFEKKTGFIFSNKNLLINFHPETLSVDFGISSLLNLLKELENYDHNILFTSPNADAGSDQIKKTIDQFIKKNDKRSFYIPSLGQHLFLNSLILFDCVLGNSSSGIIEAPLLNSKVLNIGNRQKGRFRFGSVYDVNGDRKSISKALKEIFSDKDSDEFDLCKFKKLYKNNSPSNQIINILNKTTLN